MLFLKDEYFENSDYRELNMWATQHYAERSPRDQLLAFRFAEACDKFGVKNVLALWCFGAAKTNWFEKAPIDMKGQVKWCELLAKDFSDVSDVRKMPGITEDDAVRMSLIWTQASARLDTYAALKKNKPKLPDVKKDPIPDTKKKEDEKKPEDKREPEKPIEQAKKDVEAVDEKTIWKRAIGSISGVIALFVDKIPLPLPVKYILKAIFYTIASVFK
jgi:hypothetical protein